MSGPDRTRRGGDEPPIDPVADPAGDPACWAALLCPRCGSVPDRPWCRVCARCGAPLPED